MRSPVVYMLICLVTGLLAGMFDGGKYGILLLIAALCLSCLMKDLVDRCLGRHILILLLVCLLIGFLRGRSVFELQRACLSEETISAGGIVHSLHVSSTGTETADVALDGFEGLVRITLSGEAEISEGMRIEVEGVIEALDPPGNPGCLNPVVYYKAHGVEYLMDPETISISAVQTWNPYRLRASFLAMIRSSLSTLLPEDEAGLVMAILTGDRTDLNADIRTLFEDCGISHMIAISGLHIQVLSSLLEKLLKKVVSLRKALLMEWMMIGFYCFLTGMAVSTLRAFLMLGMKVMAQFFGRKEYTPASISVSAAILLLYRPVYIFYSSFQLSFMAVISIRYGTRCFALMRFLPAGLGNTACTSLSVTIFTLPFTLYYFYQFCPYAVLLNLIVIPLMSGIVLLSVFAVLLSPLFPTASLTLMGSVYAIIRFYAWICTWVSRLPFSQITTGRPGWVIMVILCAVLFLSVASCTASMKNRIRILRVLGLLVACFVLFSLYDRFDDRFYLLNTGQGDCAVFFSDGKTIIVDAGPRYDSVLSNVLKSEGVTYVDAVFLSHMDADHSEGVIELLEDEDFTVGTLYLPDIGEDILSESEAFQYAEEVVLISAGDSAAYGGFVFDCLSPVSDVTYADENSASMCLRVRSENVTILMTGDMDQEAEEVLLQNGTDVSCDILKVAHHGSYSSSSSGFLMATGACVGFISCGENNLYGHPHQDTLKRLEDAGIESYISWESGALCYRYGRLTLYKEAYWRRWMQ